MDALELPFWSGIESGVRKGTVGAAYTHLRQEGTATPRDIQSSVYAGSALSERPTSTNAREWWSTACEPYLWQLPGVIEPESGATWEYTAPSPTPTPPQDPKRPVGGDVWQLVNSVTGGQGAAPRRSRTALRDAYMQLASGAEVARTELRAHYTPAGSLEADAAPGVFDSGEKWWAAFGYTYLARMPGTVAPTIPGDEWV